MKLGPISISWGNKDKKTTVPPAPPSKSSKLKKEDKTSSKTKKKGIDDRPKLNVIAPGRSSEPDLDEVSEILTSEYAIVSPDFLTEIIPIIRSLAKNNPDVSQALHNIVALGNTGHKVFFDRSVPETQVDKMRNHLDNMRKKWAPGQAGMDGLVNKLISQVMIGGALSGEAVPNNDLTGIRSIILVNVESIRFKLAEDKITYEPYQKLKNTLLTNKRRDLADGDLIKLNPETYQYYALNGDGENPYGFPPYMSVLKRVESQGKMHQNIDFIIDIMGLVGFLQVLIQKPDEEGNENQKKYQERLNNLLDQARENILGGMKDGVVVGFKDDHEFDFQSASKGYKDVAELFKANEMQVFSALKQDPSLAGRDYGTSEAKANVTFVKLLSELKNVQNLVKSFLEFVYALELRLAGYDFDFLTVRFNRSTLQDDYKFQQAEEIKIRNILYKLVAGIINQEQAADELGYEAPFAKKPLVPYEMLIGKGSKPAEGDKKKRQGQKGKSAKKGRATKKPVSKDYK